jgi:hypothetical protein
MHCAGTAPQSTDPSLTFQGGKARNKIIRQIIFSRVLYRAVLILLFIIIKSAFDTKSSISIPEKRTETILPCVTFPIDKLVDNIHYGAL